MEKKERRSLEEILDSLKTAEKEYDEKLDKYGLKVVKQQKPEEDENIEEEKQNSNENFNVTQEQPIENNETNI